MYQNMLKLKDGVLKLWNHPLMVLVVLKKWLPWFGQSVYSKLKYESGAHRVQRVPVTESQGRVHTSTATVLVMPEVEEVEYDIDPKDLSRRFTTRLVLVVRMSIKLLLQFVWYTFLQESKLKCKKSVLSKNRDKAMKIIRARVADHFAQIAQDEQDAERKSTVGTGDRSERIRTYNFPQIV